MTTVQRLEHILSEAEARRLRVLALKVSPIEFAHLCRLAQVTQIGLLTFSGVPLQVVRD